LKHLKQFEIWRNKQLAEKIQQDIQKQIDEAVNAIKKETETQIASLKEKANQNLSKAMDQIVEDLLRIIT